MPSNLQKLEVLLIPALITAGTCDPNEVLPLLEDALKVRAFLQLERFLVWVHDNNHRVGRDNFRSVWARWRARDLDSAGGNSWV